MSERDDTTAATPPGSGDGATTSAATATAETPAPPAESTTADGGAVTAPAPSAIGGEGGQLRTLLSVPFGWILDDPILLKELRAAFRRRRFLVAMTSLLSLTALVLLIAIFMWTEQGGSNNRPDPTKIGRTVFFAFSVIQAIVTFLVFPAFSCMSITEERSNKSFDLLITTCLPAHRIVRGKFLASFVYCFTFMAATLPLVSLAFLFGGVTPSDIALTYLAQGVSAALVTAFAIFASSACGTTARAIVLTYLGMWPFYLVIFGPLGAMIHYLVIAPLAGDQASVELLDSYSTANKTLLVVGPVGFLVFVFVLLFCLAVNRLKPLSGNKSTALRILFVLFVIFGLAMGVAFAELNHETVGIEELAPTKPTHEWLEKIKAAERSRSDLIRSLFRIVALVLVAGAIVFTGEEGELPRRIAERLGRLRGPWRVLSIFYPGDRNGLRFITWITLLVVPAVTLYSLYRIGLIDDAASGWRPGGEAVAWSCLWLIAFVLFVAQLGHFLSPVIRHGVYTRLWIVFPLVAATIYPVFWFMIGSHDVPSRIYHAYYLSPALVDYSAWSEPQSWNQRSLYMTGPTGEEIRIERDRLLVPEEGVGAPGRRPSPTYRYQDDPRTRTAEARALQLARSGVPVHAVSTLVYALLAIALALWNGVIVARLWGAPPKTGRPRAPPAKEKPSSAEGAAPDGASDAATEAAPDAPADAPADTKPDAG